MLRSTGGPRSSCAARDRAGLFEHWKQPRTVDTHYWPEQKWGTPVHADHSPWGIMFSRKKPSVNPLLDPTLETTCSMCLNQQTHCRCTLQLHSSATALLNRHEHRLLHNGMMQPSHAKHKPCPAPAFCVINTHASMHSMCKPTMTAIYHRNTCASTSALRYKCAG